MPNEQAKPRRLLSQIDEELVAEGVRGIQSGRWANPHQAAKVLAERQNLTRLGFITWTGCDIGYRADGGIVESAFKADGSQIERCFAIRKKLRPEALFYLPVKAAESRKPRAMYYSLSIKL